MFKKISFLLVCSLVAIAAAAQKVKTVPVAPAAVAAPRPVYNFTTVNENLKYVFVENKPGTRHPQDGDDVMLRMIAICNNRIMYNSSQVNKGKPGAFSISKAAFKGDIADVLMLLTPGDSVICMVDAKSTFDFSKKKLPDYIKPGDRIQYNIRLVSIKTKEEKQKEQQAAIEKIMKEQAADPAPGTSKQLLEDDIALKNYFNSKLITPVKTASGLYYKIVQEGTGPEAVAGDEVVMNYRGTFTDGTIFDSNIDSAFMHVQPLTFVLGQGRVINGWEEGITHLKAGSKAFFYIPSPLAYGAQSRPGSAANPKGIPPNSILIFEVELVSIKHPAQQ